MIVCAAIRVRCSEDTVIIPCIRHSDGFRILKNFEVKTEHIEQGFVDNLNNFYTRKEAFDLVKKTGQLSQTALWYKEDRGDKELYSEDLY